jgi:hypothetical protein
VGLLIFTAALWRLRPATADQGRSVSVGSIRSA